VGKVRIKYEMFYSMFLCNKDIKNVTM